MGDEVGPAAPSTTLAFKTDEYMLVWNMGNDGSQEMQLRSDFCEPAVACGIKWYENAEKRIPPPSGASG